MIRIEFLRVTSAVSMASVVHLAAFYGMAAALPPPHRAATVEVGPIVAMGVVPTPQHAMEASREPAERSG